MTATRTYEMKKCPLCRGSGQYCTAYPKYFSPCGECNGTGKVRTYAELARTGDARVKDENAR